ncbi:MAG: GspH/FimT family pseudopilin [Granulosicoccus sp.]
MCVTQRIASHSAFYSSWNEFEILCADALPMDNGDSSGFTLLELLIAMAVAGVLLSIAAPSVSAVIQNQRLQSALGPVSLAAFTARSESAKSGDSVTLCARATDTQCGADWNNGSLVFRDGTVVRGETQAVIDNTDEILRVIPPHGHPIVLSAIASTDRTATGEYNPSFVRYEPDGGSNWKNGTFFVCDDRGDNSAIALHITISGDIRPARSSDSDGPVKDVFGRDLSC